MTTTNPSAARYATTAAPVRGADIVLNLIVIFLTPIFLSATDGDIALARLAAIETVSAYRVQSHADLLEVAQIIAFGFATLGSLCLSMADDISLTMVLRLRGNANALSRSGEVHRRRLEQSRADTLQPPPPAYPPTQTDDPHTQSPLPTPAAAPPSAEKAAATPAPVSPPETHDTQALWAAALTEAAEQFTAELPHLSPAEQQIAAIQVAALNACANDLLSEASPEQPEPDQHQGAPASQTSSSDPRDKQHLAGSA